MLSKATLLIIAGMESLRTEPIGTLEKVLHVPKLCIYLVFFQKLAKLPNVAIFSYDDYSIFMNKV